MRIRLLTLYEDVDRRARTTAAEREWWPCRRGCDTCCRRLAAVPQLVRAEWELLEEGLDALPANVRAGVDARITDLARSEREGTLARPIVCPMLDAGEGACLVYEHRPAACRTYGFYVERGIGLHCEMITQAVAERPDDPIVWGNAESVDYTLGRLRQGAAAEAPLPLTAWVASSSSTPSAAPRPAPVADPLAAVDETSSPSSEM